VQHFVRPSRTTDLLHTNQLMPAIVMLKPGVGRRIVETAKNCPVSSVHSTLARTEMTDDASIPLGDSTQSTDTRAIAMAAMILGNV